MFPPPWLSSSTFPNQEMVVSVRRDDFLTLVHPGRRVELFREPIRASELMRKYPRHCIARPDVFEFPWIAVHPEAVLPRGSVFFLVPYHTIHMLLKRRRQQQQLQQQQQHRHSSRLHLHCLSKHNYSPTTVRDDHQESCDAGNLYRLIRRLMKRNLNDEGDESSYCYYQAESPVDSSPRPRVTSAELTELLRLKPCLRQPDSDRKKLNLRVTFAAPFVSSRRGSPCDQQDDQDVQV